MKKILALVLALVMTMSVAVISSGAAYSDADKVQYVDAVNAMSALGVMGGYADGSIRPQADVTRGAAAKMVALVATGSNTTTIGYYAGTSSFADVPATHTFADVVAYCVGKGIVEGYGNGLYGVGDNVKGWAVAKMVLVAMGYDAEAFGLTGTGAALRTIELATDKGLFAGMKADFKATDAASREECAQIIYNALDLEGVKVTETTTAGTVTYGPSGTCLLDKYGFIDTGIVVANKATGADYTEIVFEVEGENGSETATYLYTNESGLDLIGHTVLVADTRAPQNTDGAWTAYALVDLSSEVVVADGEKTLDAKGVKALFGAESVSVASGAIAFADYAVVEDGSITAPAAGDVVDGTYVLTNGVVTAYMAPDTYEVTYVSDYTAVDGKTDGSLTLANGDSWVIDAEDGAAVSYYAGIADNDAVAVQQTGTLYTVSKLSTVTGKLSQMKTGETLTIGGKVYAVSAKASSDIGVEAVAAADALGYDVVAYLDLAGAVVALTNVPGEAAAAGSLVYVVDKYTIEGTDTTNAYGQVTEGYDAYYAQVVDMNGKEASLLVESLDDVPEAGLYIATAAYDTEDKVDYYTFNDEPAETDNWVIDAVAEGGVAAGALKVANNFYYASGVKFIYVAADENGDLAKLKVEVKTGAIAVPAGAAYYATKVGETANYNVQYVVIEGAYSAGNVKSDDIVYVAASGTSTDVKAITKADGTPGVAYVQSVYVNGVLKTVDAKEAAVTAGFWGYEINEDGLYEFVALENAPVVESAAVVNLYGTLLTVDAEGLADKEAKGAKIVDVYYALNSAENAELKEVTTLAGLAGMNVAVVYNADATGAATSYATIYVLGPVGE